MDALKEIDDHVILRASMGESDREIIAAVLQGDLERYAALVDRYQALALRLAFSLLGNYADAEDVSQDAFVSAYRSLAQFRGQSKFSTWLYRIVVNKCKDHSRRRRRQPAMVALGESNPDLDGACLFVDVEDPSAGPNDRADSRELLGRLSVAIEALPMKQRTAFALHHLQGLSLEEVAAVMRCRQGTVKSHIFRATAQLRSMLSPWLSLGKGEPR